ncbi:phosphotransferase family protein [Aquihabitans sp. G128]|uniref:phosphotransferase family protein n=1 Tax=Aquihabitans sp. G128 TaxID=2849779 RepID=UPI001C23DA3C|nr:phosphotransferase family protein [Aquihabitans sp. G128]QXC61539.1 phosphotransferase family protein [Aquihabitans sp. G128]
MTATSPVPGIDVDHVTAWFAEHAPEAVPPLAFELIAGGRSNLTFRVTDQADGAWVLRRPPRGHVLATAHDMGREHRIISALAPTDVPVAPVVGLCTDPEVNDGAPFYVMSFVDGLVLRDARAAEDVSPEVRRRAGLSIAETLAKIHAIDPDAVGLGDLGRKEGYVARQLKRWNGQFENSEGQTGPVTEAYDRLLQNIPEQGPAAIVHGDYRLDNCMVDDAGEVIAVLDWEICTLGDPLADLGVLMVYWTEPGDPYAALPGAATVLDGFPSRAELVAAYEAAGGRSVGDLDYYVAFGYWKLACILQGVAVRYQAGAMGDDGASGDAFGDMVNLLGQASLASLDKIGT